MIRSADWLCEKHFGKNLVNKGVEILDPATGTGTYIVELLEYFRGQPEKLRYTQAEKGGNVRAETSSKTKSKSAFVRTKAGLRVQGIKLEPDVLIMSCADGLSFRTANMACDIPADGSWPSPIRANGAMLRRLAPKLSGPDIVLHYEDSRLMINTTQISASEV